MRRVSAETVRQLYGPRPSLRHIIKGLERLYENNLEESYDRGDSEADDKVYYEQLLHELGHFYSLSEEVGSSKDMTLAIRSLGPMAQAGNEVDALAFTAVLSEWLGYRLGIGHLVSIGLTNSPLIPSSKLLRSLVNLSADSPKMTQLCRDVARVVYEYAYLEKKEEQDNDYF